MRKRKRKACYFCRNQIEQIDYKDVQILQRHVSGYQKIVPRKRSGVCMKHQRKLAKAIKRARYMGLMPYTH
ncbi:MAG: 30S ribosomal protein S18 [Patescibacteria group bacterium]|nr:30S ribosomal protein S18 [Patescibacteria group bacterium]